MKLFILISFVFWLGFSFGRWDAKYGTEAGERWGKATREFFRRK